MVRLARIWLAMTGKIGEDVEFLKFDELEKKITGLIEDYALLKKRNLELEEQLKNKTTELEEFSKKIVLVLGKLLYQGINSSQVLSMGCF